jgi:uncharacterized metal-binding protein YceD (DUF177 family)
MGKTKYIISTGGLPVGNHEFEFEVTDTFFKDTDTEEIKGVNVNVRAILLKQNNVMQLQFELGGTVNINCDRCLKAFDIPVEGTEHLVIKNGKPSDSTDEVLMVPEGETQLDVTQYIYEYVLTAVPVRKVPCEIDSKKFKCDKAVLKKLNENSISAESAEDNPLWEQLNKLKNNKN